MSDFFEDVGEFHYRFGQPYTDSGRDDRCRFPSPEELEYRIKFLKEEITEFEEATENQDLPKALDALVDLVYVALGTAHYFHAPFVEAWDEVHAANMRKVRASPEDHEHKRGPVEPMRKPPGWIPPDIEKVIEDYNEGRT